MGMSTGGSLDDPLFAPDAEGVGDFDEDEVFGRMDHAAFGLPGVGSQTLSTSRRPADGPEGYRRRKMEEINAQMDQLLRAARPAPPRRERRSLRERRRREEEERKKREERGEGTADDADAERRRAMAELTASPPAPRRRAAAAATMPPPSRRNVRSFRQGERHPSLGSRRRRGGTSFESESPDPLAAAPSRRCSCPAPYLPFQRTPIATLRRSSRIGLFWERRAGPVERPRRRFRTSRRRRTRCRRRRRRRG